MSDDIFKKLADILSGSISKLKENDPQQKDVPEEISKEQNLTIEDSIFEALFNNPLIEEKLAKNIEPCYILGETHDGSSHHWLFNVTTKTMVAVSKNSEIFPAGTTEDGKMICFIGPACYYIPIELVVCVGYN